MTQHFSKIIALGLVLFCARSFCVAQIDSWERLSSVESGSKLIVVLTNGDAMEGRLREWAPAGLTILHKNGVLSVPKTDIRKIMLVSRRSRLRIGGGLAQPSGVRSAARSSEPCVRAEATVEPHRLLWPAGPHLSRFRPLAEATGLVTSRVMSSI